MDQVDFTAVVDSERLPFRVQMGSVDRITALSVGIAYLCQRLPMSAHQGEIIETLKENLK
jgi:hypothetical protein